MRGGKGGLGAAFSIAGEGGDALPVCLVGEQGTFCAARCSPPQLRAGWRVVFLQLRSRLLSLPWQRSGERCREVEGEGSTSSLSRSPKQVGVRSRTPFGVPHATALCSSGLHSYKAPHLALAPL